jgi:hypothetical protein
MCLPLEAPHIKKLLSPVLHDILCPNESHPPVTSLFNVSSRTSRSTRAWRRTLGRPPICHISPLFRQWVLPTKKTFFHLWVSICKELRGKCDICKDAIRQLRWSALLFTYQSGLRSSSGAGNSFFLFVPTSCSKSLTWNGPCQHVQF